MENEITTVEQFAQALSGDGAPEEQELETAQPEAEAETEEAPEAEQVEEEQEADDSEESEGDEPEEPESLDDRTVEWETAAGDKFSVPVSELKQGYMRSQDYTQKTQELSRERDTFQQQAKELVQQQLQAVEGYAQELGALHVAKAEMAQYHSMIQQIDPNVDPIGHSAAVSQFLLAQNRATDLANRVGQVQLQRTQEQQAAIQAAQKQAFEKLTTDIPGFGRETLQQLNATGRNYGFTDAELGGIADARMIKVLHDAMKFREMQAKADVAVKKVKAAPPKPAKQTASKPASGVEKDMKQFGAKQDLNSFARLYQHTIK